MSPTENQLTLEMAYEIVKKLVHARDAKILADIQWMSSNLKSPTAEEDVLSNARDEKILQRNQVLFCVGLFDKEEFKYSDIEALIRQRFPNSNQGAVLNVAHALSELAGDETGILQRTPEGKSYMLKDPLFRSCIIKMLRCDEGSEIVEKIVLSKV
ncbi:MAG: hypothetical protein R8K20_06185 [Gallionellaceae bacterium]